MDSFWFVAGGAFLLGLFAGWLAFGSALNRSGEEAGQSDDGWARAGEAELPSTPDAPEGREIDRDRLAALGDELAALKALADADDNEEAAAAERAFAAELDEIDQAISRANNRLKAVLKSLKRGKHS